MRILSLCLVVVCLALLCRAADTAHPTLAVGSKAPDFNLPGVDGRTYTLADFSAAKILVVIFTCNHCPTAQAYQERIRSFVDRYKDRGVNFVAISPNDDKSVRLDELGYTDLGDSFAEMKIRAQVAKFNFPYLYDGESEAASRAYGPAATPHAFVFDSDRTLRYAGRIDDSEREEFVRVRDLEEALEAVLAGHPVANSQTRAHGCSIKWSDKREEVALYMARLAAEPVTVEMADAEALRSLLKNDEGKLRLINVWATWCGPCVTEFPEFVTIHRMYRHRAFEVVTVAANFPDEKQEVLGFLTRNQASTRNLMFGTTAKYDLMEALDPDWNSAIPYTILVAADGRVLYKHQGSIDALELRRLIVRSLKEDRFR